MDVKKQNKQQNQQKDRRDTIPKEVHQEASRIAKNLMRLPAKTHK